MDFLALLALGIAGFDPVASLGMLAAVSSGARRRSLLAYAVGAWVACTGLGIVLATAVGRVMLRWWHRVEGSFDHATSGALMAGAGAVVLVWAIWRLLRRASEPKRSEQADEPKGQVGLGLTGLALGATCLADPSFYAMVLFTSRFHDARTWLYPAVWTCLSHVLVLTVAAAVALNRHHAVARVLVDARERHEAGVRKLLLVTGTFLGLGMVAQGALAWAGWPWVW